MRPEKAVIQARQIRSGFTSRADQTAFNALLFLFGPGVAAGQAIPPPCRRRALSGRNSGASRPPNQQGVGLYHIVVKSPAATFELQPRAGPETPATLRWMVGVATARLQVPNGPSVQAPTRRFRIGAVAAHTLDSRSLGNSIEHKQCMTFRRSGFRPVQAAVIPGDPAQPSPSFQTRCWPPRRCHGRRRRYSKLRRPRHMGREVVTRFGPNTFVLLLRRFSGR